MLQHVNWRPTDPHPPPCKNGPRTVLKMVAKNNTLPKNSEGMAEALQHYILEYAWQMHLNLQSFSKPSFLDFGFDFLQVAAKPVKP